MNVISIKLKKQWYSLWLKIKKVHTNKTAHLNLSFQILVPSLNNSNWLLHQYYTNQNPNHQKYIYQHPINPNCNIKSLSFILMNLLKSQLKGTLWLRLMIKYLGFNISMMIVVLYRARNKDSGTIFI